MYKALRGFVWNKMINRIRCVLYNTQYIYIYTIDIERIKLINIYIKMRRKFLFASICSYW